MPEGLLLIAAGVAAGLAGSMAGLASLVSYPALLAYGLPPITANITNTTAMVATGVGAALSSRRELHGLVHRVVRVCSYMALGSLLGAGLLLTTPPELFVAVVPWLVALGSVLLMCREAARRALIRLGEDHPFQTWAWPLATVAVGVYAGYFGAGAGIMLLAVLAAQHNEALPIANAVKNIGTGAANVVAAAIFVLQGRADLSTAATLAAGLLAGAWMGPHLFRRVPERPLRYLIACAGFGLAGWLLLTGGG